VARVATISSPTGLIVAGVPVIRNAYGPAMGLPEEGVECVVSGMVAAAVPSRAGVYAPATGSSAVRENGQVVAVTELVAA
jgi:hypothetical protein